MLPLETFDENGKPQYFVGQQTVQALQGLIAKAVSNPNGFSSDITAAEAKALRDLGDAKTKMTI